MSTPLGKYAQIVAAGITIALIAAYLVALLGIIPVPSDRLGLLQDIALVAVGAVFGSAAQLNGYKAPIAAIGAKVDAHTAQLTALGQLVADNTPAPPEAVAAIIGTDAAGPAPAQAGG